MASLRLCSHIKTNGVKCGSPALRHHTMCYFHYQWQRRDQRRVRLGGPIGMNKNSGIELPLLDGPEAILVSIMEIQNAMLDQRIPVKTATALLYSLQLALQAKLPYSGLCHREPVRECPELDMDLEMERAKSLRPAKEKCSRCPQQETCLSPRNCKKLPKLPAGYRREADRLVRDSQDESPQPCHPERSSSALEMRNCGAEEPALSLPKGPFVSPPETTALATATAVQTSPASLRECSPGREPGVTDRKLPPIGAPHLPQLADVGSTNARRQIDATDAEQTVPQLRDSSRSAQVDPHSLRTENRELGTKPAENGEQRTDNPFSHNILGFNTHPDIYLPGKFPQLVETTQPENQGVGITPSIR